MSIDEIKTYKITCDSCKKSVKLKRKRTPQLPEGWSMQEFEGGGHYGLPIISKDFCPKCTKVSRSIK